MLLQHVPGGLQLDGDDPHAGAISGSEASTA
jgi:hypothetical protein